MSMIFGAPIGFSIYYFGSRAAYDANMLRVFGFFANESSKTDVGLLYLGAFLICCMIQWVNGFPMVFKQAMELKANIRANMYFYKILPSPDFKPANKVVLDEDGVLGQYNRSNRSLHHMTESIAILILSFVL